MKTNKYIVCISLVVACLHTEAQDLRPGFCQLKDPFK